jgi:predicted membrane-bound spermidine synthase
MSARYRIRLLLIAAAFFLSGGAALVYQVVWQRLLALHTGIGVTSIALIVSAFMAGLGFGSQAGGVYSARVTPARALRLFAGIELLVAAFASVSCRLYYEGPQHWSWIYGSTFGMGVAHFTALLLPTFLMGLSLPFLTRAMVRDAATAPRTIAVLYGLNTLGAGVGALLAPWVLIRFIGIPRAVLCGVAANVAAGLAALVAARLQAVPAPAPIAAPTAEPAVPSGATEEDLRQPLGLWLGLYALSGFCALSLEILWFRLLDVSVKSTAFTFGTVLAIYLLGVAGGSLWGALRSHRLRHPLERFLTLQCAILVYSAAGVTLLARLPPTTPIYDWFFKYWAIDSFFQLGADWDLGRLLRLYGLLPGALFGPPTVMMGLSFAALQRAVHDDPRTSGQKVGWLQAANIAGCVAGTLVVGLVLLQHGGTVGAFRVLLVLGLVFPAVLAWQRRRFGVVWAALLVATLAVLPGSQLLWTKLHGIADTTRPSFIGEDATAVSAVTPGVGDAWRVTVNGLPHSWVPFQGIHTLLGATPALVHPAPLEVAVIGLGSGETAWAVSCRPETQSIDVYEIAAAQPGLLRSVADVMGPSELGRFLSDPRVHITAADGRNALLRSEKKYDVIQVDALFRTSAMSGTLYSVEFFKLCGRRLKPGGIVCSQAPSRRAAQSLAAALPFAMELGGNIMIGSNDEIPIDPAAWSARLDAVADYFGAGVAEGIRERLHLAHRLKLRTHRGLNLDLFPRDELGSPIDQEP